VSCRRVATQDGNDFSADCFNSQIADMSDDCDIRIACCAALAELSGKLYALNESLERSFSSQHFIRLTERILIEREYGGVDISTKVRTDIAQWKNATPDDEIDNGRNDEMNKAYNNIVEMKFRRNFQDYMKTYSPDIDQKKNAIGKFLFHCRRDITESELNDFMTNLFRIIYLRKDQLKDMEENRGDEVTSAPEADSCNPDIFLSEKLSSSHKARQRFYDLLIKAGPHICRKLTAEQKKDASIRKYKGWSWWHLKQGFIRLGFIEKDISDKDFFKFLSMVIPGRSQGSISQGYYRTPHSSSDGIVEKVMEEFSTVANLLPDSSLKGSYGKT